MSRGYFGVAFYYPTKSINVGTLFRTAQVLEADFLATIGYSYRHQSSDTMKSIRHMPLFHFDTFDEFKKTIPINCSLVAVELTESARPIERFTHPERAVYLLGSEAIGLPEHVLDRCDFVVRLLGERSLNVSVAGSVVLYHRSIQKQGKERSHDPT